MELQYGAAVVRRDLIGVFAVPVANNPASARVLEKAGFVHEGRLKSSAIKGGQVLDHDLLASIRPRAAARP